ncbi:hypothetical protein E2C01_009751 [Portunus trituberculatus]|uniref:Uncharacterized protein n=1 Tax=Portunus trituberculatus TaxID=210409 RepID=A0A5B7D6M2_PORTR|nr:hypothetical protein [Portunus trituberculatus]
MLSMIERLPTKDQQTLYRDYVFGLDRLTIFVENQRRLDTLSPEDHKKCASITRLNNALFRNKVIRHRDLRDTAHPVRQTGGRIASAGLGLLHIAHRPCPHPLSQSPSQLLVSVVVEVDAVSVIELVLIQVPFRSRKLTLPFFASHSIFSFRTSLQSMRINYRKGKIRGLRVSQTNRSQEWTIRSNP